jgi:hypothetical protein
MRRAPSRLAMTASRARREKVALFAGCNSFCWRGAPSGISERIRAVQRRAFSSELPHQRCYLWAADIGKASHPRPRAGKWRCRRPPSLEYIPSLGATTRTCSFPCFGCTGRRLRPWLRRVAPVRMSARTTPRSGCSGGPPWKGLGYASQEGSGFWPGSGNRYDRDSQHQIQVGGQRSDWDREGMTQRKPKR